MLASGPLTPSSSALIRFSEAVLPVPAPPRPAGASQDEQVQASFRECGLPGACPEPVEGG
jgi:hypothetical protein